MSKIEWSITYIPAMEIIAICSACRAEIVRLKYDDYKDKVGKLDALKVCVLKCPKCEAIFDTPSGS